MRTTPIDNLTIDNRIQEGIVHVLSEAPIYQRVITHWFLAYWLTECHRETVTGFSRVSRVQFLFSRLSVRWWVSSYFRQGELG